MTARPSLVLFSRDAELGRHAATALAPIADLRLAPTAELWMARRAIAFPCVTLVDARALEHDAVRMLRSLRPDLAIVFADDVRAREAAESAGAFALLGQAFDPHALRTAVRQALAHLDATEALAGQREEPAAPASTASSPGGAGRLLAEALRKLDDPDALCERVLDCLALPLGAARASLYLGTEAGGPYVRRAGHGPPAPGAPPRFERDAPLAQRLRTDAQILSRIGLARLDEERERRAAARLLELFGADFVVPLFAASELAGWIALGPRATGLPYTALDLAAAADSAQAVGALLRLAQARVPPERVPGDALWTGLSDSLSHEIRNPLVAIKTFVQLLPERFQDAEFREAFGKLAMEEVARISDVIDTLERFAHPAPLTRTRLDPRRLVEETVERTIDATRRRNLRLTVRMEPGLPPVEADAAALIRALEQVLRHADEAIAAQSDPEIRVSAASRTGPDGRLRVTVSVTDNAPALPPAERAKLFEPFASLRIRGTGLGLPEARRTLLRHGGRLLAEAGQAGNTITIELPAAEEATG